MPDTPAELGLFRQILNGWRKRPDPTEPLTLNQIAHLGFGSGTAKNAALAGHVMTVFRDYFTAPSVGGHKWRVKWEKVDRDYPELLHRPGSQSRQTALSPLGAMAKALDDEIAAVQRENLEHPIQALGAADFDVSRDGSFLYEAVVQLQGDIEPPIPEGVNVRLWWRNAPVEPGVMEGTLLSWDPLGSRAIFEVERPLSLAHKRSTFLLLPAVEELLKALQTRLQLVAARPDALSWKLLDGRCSPAARDSGTRLGLRGLDPPQAAAVRAACTRDVAFIWGPPGTGKTYTLAQLIAETAAAGRRVIATSIANVAVDQLARRVVLALEGLGGTGCRLLDEGKVLRFGHARLPEVSGERRLFPNREEIQRLRKALHEAREAHAKIPQADAHRRAVSQKLVKDLSDALRDVTRRVINESHIVLTTAIQTCIESAFDEEPFDIMIVDEASMMPIPFLLCMGALASKHFVVAGDFRQLGPIAVSRTQVAYDWLHRDGFELVGIKQRLDHPAVSMLTVQRRMHPAICEMVNYSYYANRLTTHVEPDNALLCEVPPLPGRAVVMVRLLPEDGSAVEQTVGHSRLNACSATVTTRLVSRILRTRHRAEIGVITPYRAQVSEIKRQLKSEGIEVGGQVKVGTIHAFQGSEAEIVIWDLVETRSHPIGKLYHEETGDRLANVAMSRAKGKLIIVGDPDAFLHAAGGQHVREVKRLLAARFVGDRDTVDAREFLSG